MELLPEARIYAPDLRGYPGTTYAKTGYDVFTVTDDIRALIETLGIQGCLLVTHDWGAALGWLFAQRYGSLIGKLMVVNCTHPKTLVRAALTLQDWQIFRMPWVPFFEIPWFPEWFISSDLGRRLLRWSFTVREGHKGTMDRGVVDEIVGRFRTPADIHGAIQYYRSFFRTLLVPSQRKRLYALYDRPISIPVTVVWGMEDGALPWGVAIKSFKDAGCEGEWRPLPGVGHFVHLEAWTKLAHEIKRLL